MKRATLLMLCAGIALAEPAMAKDYTGSGTATYIPVSAATRELPNGNHIRRVHSKSIIVADDEEIPFHLASQDCLGTYVLTPEGEIITGKGYCDAVDQDGDVWWLWWQSEEESGEWGILEGTGKYAGMVGSGTTTPIASHDDGRFAVRWKGSWVMK